MQSTYRHTRRACYLGYLTQGIVNSLAPLLFTVFQTDYQISFAQLGQLILLNFGTQLCMDFFSVCFVDRIGIRHCIIGSHLTAMVGLLLMGILPNLIDPFTGLSIAMVCCAMGSGLIEDLVSPILDSLPIPQKASSMSLLHSFCCWGQVAVIALTTLSLHYIGSQQWFLLPILWALIPLINLVRFLHVPIPPALPPEKKTPVRSLLHSRLFLLCMLMVLCAGASDLTMSQWSSLFAERGLGVEKVTGDLLGPCLFSVLEGTGRLLYGLFGKKIKLHTAVLSCSVLCVICYLTASLSPYPLPALLGCALCGFSVSLMWPGLYSLAARSFPHGGTSMFGLLAVCGDIGCSLGPWLTGLAGAEDAGLKRGLLLAVIFPIIMVAGMLCFCLREHRHSDTKSSNR
ncbi:MAG: MFS transporter [Oscillospiraceae bacterium]|jgi:fucose permease|nr:MFS transporter [Oscillospiraceae bacterium]HCA71760.1 MFS transporter [Oscillospiraceae bacterium]